VRSNVGDALAASLRQELGRELERAQAEVRARVDGLVQQQVTEAQSRVRQLGDSIETRIAQPRAELGQVQERIRAEINRLTGGLPIPGGDGE
jgi:plasmid stabilization system protein ParE